MDSRHPVLRALEPEAQAVNSVFLESDPPLVDGLQAVAALSAAISLKRIADSIARAETEITVSAASELSPEDRDAIDAARRPWRSNAAGG